MAKKDNPTPLKAIRNHCLNCQGWDDGRSLEHKPVKNVSDCLDFKCHLHNFRFGKNPFHHMVRMARSLDNLKCLKK